jgi:hypothetical protein
VRASARTELLVSRALPISKRVGLFIGLLFAALRWGHERGLNVLEKNSLDKSLTETLDLLIDHWLVCTQRAGVWASASAQSLGAYSTRLSLCVQALANEAEISSATALLKQCLEWEVKEIEQAAVNG